VRILDLPVNKEQCFSFRGKLCCNKQPLLDRVSLLRRDAKQQGSQYYEEKHFFFTLRG